MVSWYLNLELNLKNMNLKRGYLFVPLLILIAGLSSCYPVDDLTVADLDIAVTLYDTTYYPGPSEAGINKFQELQTFIVVDTVMHIIAEGEEDNIRRSLDAYVLEQIRLNMLKLGFSEEMNPAITQPDIAITVSVMTSEHEVYYWYPYWGWYWGYGGYYPYRSTKNTVEANYYYYPWYPYSTYYTYQSGTLLMEMVDVARIDPEVEAIPIIWAGLVNGVMEDSQENTKIRLTKGIDQCFNQAPYLLKTLE